MYRACGKCGKIHDDKFICITKREYKGGTERKLRSTYGWKKKSEEIRERANHLCEVCRDRGVLTYDDLEVHHIVKLKDDEAGLLDNLNLVTLCPYHHKQADNGELDAEYLKMLARERER